MTHAQTIVERMVAKKYPLDGRYLFTFTELVEIVKAIQHDAQSKTKTKHSKEARR